jgi:hypothetical protein
MIEKHYGKYIRNDIDEQLSRLVAVTPAVPPRKAAGGYKPSI